MGALLLLLLVVMVLATINLLPFSIRFGDVLTHEPAHLQRLLLRPFVIRDLRPKFTIVRAGRRVASAEFKDVVPLESRIVVANAGSLNSNTSFIISVEP